MWFDSWTDLIRILVVGSAGYGSLILVLRASGKRTLSQLNAFDFVVTVSLGSTLATLLLSADTSWAEGVLALALLAFLQFLMAWVSTHWPRARKAFTSEPALLLADGAMQGEALRRNRLTESEVRQAIRMQGNGDLAQVRAVVLESNGTLSVITSENYGNGSALVDVRGVGAL
ncbi:MAG: YetF domain-containing protein [Arachnia sp.]